MNPPLAHEGLGTVASRLAVRVGEGNWSAHVVSHVDAIPAVIEDLAFETEPLLGEPVARIEAPSDDEDFVTRLHGIAGGVADPARARGPDRSWPLNLEGLGSSWEPCKIISCAANCPFNGKAG